MGKRIGAQIVEAMQDFTQALERGEDIAERYTVRHVRRNLHPAHFDAKKVKATRKLLNASQAVFAWFLGVNVQTVRAWEQGVNPPSDIACRFMELIRDRPELMRQRLREMAGVTEPVNSAARRK